MKTKLRRCTHCNRYSMKEKCPVCSEPTECQIPARYSPEDRYAKYRRMTKEE